MAGLGLGLCVPFKKGIGGAAAPTYATFDTTFNSGLYTWFPNNNTAVRGGGGGWEMTRTNLTNTTGKWYWEITATTATFIIVGFGTSAAGAHAYVGQDAGGRGYYNQNGQLTYNGGFTAYGATWTAGDVIGIALDLDGSTVTYYKNGVSQGAYSFATFGAAVYAMISMNTAAQICTANYGASAFSYSVPTGYNSGWYN